MCYAHITWRFRYISHIWMHEMSRKRKINLYNAVIWEVFCCLQMWAMCHLLTPVCSTGVPLPLAPNCCTMHATCVRKCMLNLSLSLYWYLGAFVLTPAALSLIPPSFESMCDIRRSNCQVWSLHSLHCPAYQHSVTLTTVYYRFNGDPGFTLAHWEYTYI